MSRLRRYAFLLALPLVPWLQLRVNGALGEFRSQEEVLYLWSGEQVRRLSPGFESVMADVYWLRTVQYFGGQRLFTGGKRFDLLEPLIDITTALDPRLEIAYRYGAIFLCEPSPIGAGQPEAGIALLKRATLRWPDSWRLRQELGFFSYLFLRDADEARRILLEAARLPGAPYWLEGMAGNIMVKTGDRKVARKIWEDMYRSAEEGIMRENAKANLLRLDALDMSDVLQTLAGRYREQLGDWPQSLEALVSADLLPRVPADPLGTPFAYDPATGDVWISRESMLWMSEASGRGQ